MMDLKEHLDRIEDLTKDFAKVNSKWKSIIYSNKDDGDMEALENKLEEIYFEAIKQAIIHDSDIDKLNEDIAKILGNKAFVGLNTQMQSIIIIFKNANYISSCSDPALFIADCFDRAILRRDPDFVNEEWKKFGFESEQSMLASINAINSIVFNHTSMAFCKNTAKKEFKKLTDFDDALCAFYAEKFDSSFDKLQTRMMFRTQREINNNIRAMIDILTEEE